MDFLCSIHPQHHLNKKKTILQSWYIFPLCIGKLWRLIFHNTRNVLTWVQISVISNLKKYIIAKSNKLFKLTYSFYYVLLKNLLTQFIYSEKILVSTISLALHFQLQMQNKEHVLLIMAFKMKIHKCLIQINININISKECLF